MHSGQEKQDWDLTQTQRTHRCRPTRLMLRPHLTPTPLYEERTTPPALPRSRMLFSFQQNPYPQTPLFTPWDSTAQSTSEKGSRREGRPSFPWSPAKTSSQQPPTATQEQQQGRRALSPSPILSQPPTIFNSEDFLSLLWFA